jgi:transcriptional regulator GlxA family with amidase domain
MARRVAVVAFPDVQILDVTGPLEVFARTTRWLRDHGRRGDDAYRVELLAGAPGPLVTSSGVRLVADRALAPVRGGIAAAGLLDGRRVTTHWRACEQLARRFPSLRVDPEPIFVRDGAVYTSAGVTAGMDLALALVEEDEGREVALHVARELVLFLRRPGGQSQFSAQLAVQLADREPLRELQAWIADHLGADCSVEALAARVAMSPRNFARVFAHEVGVTPARFVERVRVEAARRRLEESAHGVERIAAHCGFGSSESMRRAFLRTLRVPPTAYRSRFRADPSVGRLPRERASVRRAAR